MALHKSVKSLYNLYGKTSEWSLIYLSKERSGVIWLLQPDLFVHQ